MSLFSKEPLWVQLKLPVNLHQWLSKRIQKTGRSLEKEIIHIVTTYRKKAKEDEVSAMINVMHHLNDLAKIKRVKKK